MKSRTDTEIRRTTAIVLAVGLFAGGDSYTHIYSLARTHGQDVVSAALLPLAGDGLVIAASRVMLIAASRGLTVPARARIAFWGGSVATLAANAAYGYLHGYTSAALSIWAVAAYLGCTEMLTWMHEHLKQHPKKAAASTHTSADVAPGASNGLDPDASPEPETAERLRQRAPRRSLEELLALAEEKFPGVRTGSDVPTYRDIQAALGLGIPNTKLVQAHLKSIWAQDSVAALLSAGV